MGRRKNGRSVNGVLVLDKPPGMTSNAALQEVRKLFGAIRAGHTGTLDPAATGVLPLCFGEAAKFARFLLNADKYYRCRCRFGVTTDTGDADGKILQRRDASGLQEEDVRGKLANFRGDIAQIPPMYSAVKINGQRLHQLARRGLCIERPARAVVVYRLDMLSFHPGAQAEAELEIHCGKGVYIRTLVEDLGHSLGTGAHVCSLHRTSVSGFSQKQAVSLQSLRDYLQQWDGDVLALDKLLLPPDAMVAHLPRISVSTAKGRSIRCGHAVCPQTGDSSGWVRIHLDSGEFLGVGEMLDDGMLAPRRLMAA